MERCSSFAWQITVVLAIYVSVVFISGKFAVKELSCNAAETSRRKIPWGIDCSFILFLLYAVLFPTLSLSVTSRLVPSLKIDVPSRIQINSNAFQSNDSSKESLTVADNRFQSDNKSKRNSIATQHPMARLLIRAYGTPKFYIVSLFFFLAVVCVAPLVEEFIFRVVMQGAFENIFLIDRNQEDADAQLPIFIPSKWKICLTIGIPATIFALLHIGTAETSNAPISCDVLFQTTISSLISNVGTILVGTIILYRFFGVVSNDLGCNYFNSYRLWDVLASFSMCVKDFYKGIVLYLIAAPIILGVNVFAQKIFPNVIVAPIPIFIFAVWNGFIYYKTHKYVLCVGSHIALNFTSFIFLLINIRVNTFEDF